MNVSKSLFFCLVTLACAAANRPASAAPDFVGNLSPTPASATPRAVGDATGLVVSVQVFEPGITDAPGQGPGILCRVSFGPAGGAQGEVAMAYGGDVGNNDRYTAAVDTAALAAGNHTVRAWCSDDGGATQQFNANGPAFLSMTPLPVPPPGTALVQLFEWKYSDVAQECADLAGGGYTGVQVASPAEHKSHLTVGGNPWWVRYQPVSYLLESRSGTALEFADMVAACDAAGIDVIVDVIINHMSNAGGGALGTAGTFYFGNSYNFPGTHGPADFHYCGTNPGTAQEHDLNNFASRFETQTCELSGLADIDTALPAPRATIGAYLQGLMDMGVDGFRIDAAKHVASSDLAAILGALTPAPYVVQEVIDNASENVRYFEYLVNGDVTEFDYGTTVGSAFLGCGSSPAQLANLGPGLYHSDDALVFTDNHDTQRSGFGCVITHQAGALYDLANVFMLAHPFGYPRVMSSYWYGSDNQGPPASAGVTRDVWIDGEPAGCNASDWVCEHRRPAMANTARLRALAGNNPLTDWWDDGGQRIAFGRGDRGFVAINAAAAALNRTWSTSMAAGTYCNVARYEIAGDPATCRYPGGEFPAPTSDLVDVDGNGDIINLTLDAQSALVIHAESQAAIADMDTDGIPDDLDNCSAVSNAGQLDTNADGFGNACDPDLNDDGIVNTIDLGLLRLAFFSTPASPGWNPDADFNGDGVVNPLDLATMRLFFFGPPGPGALVPPTPPVCGAPDTGLDPAAAYGEVMFLRGNMAGDWSAVNGLNDFSNLGGDQYLVELSLSAGTFDYKVADAGWSIERSNLTDTLTQGASVVLQDNGAGSPNAIMSVPANGCYSFTLDTTDTDLPVLSMERKF